MTRASTISLAVTAIVFATSVVQHVPTGAGASAAAALPRVVPTVPAGHPRVYLRPSDLPTLRAKSKDRSARQLWHAVLNRGSDPVVLAFTGLLEQDPSKCAKAVDAMTEVIKKTVSYHGKHPTPKETTAAGRTFLSVQHEGAVVLDWCYDTMDNETKLSFVDGMKKVANMDAPGYPIDWGPPPHWDTIVGHPCEGWIFTGQLPSGLAMYDIDPSMYEGAARYFFEGLLPVRQLAYPALKHYEGSHYTYARYEHEIASAMIWNAIGHADVFPSSQPAVMSDYIYALLPNGTMNAYGDCEVSPGETLQDEKAMCMTMASALYAGRTPPDGETVLPEHLRWVVDHPPVPGATKGSWGSDYRSGLVSVINFIHIPSDAPNSTDIATLPTSRYFPDPMGEMVVRTGWDLNATSTDTIVALRIGGLFFGNHQRRDAGSFQIFYRSPLAMSSGHYGSYGSSHWKNYYHSSISVNSLLVLDPNEGTENINGNAGVNVGGQRMPIYDQPKDLATLMDPDNGYRIGKVVAHGWEEVAVPTVPRWNWLSGDITDAYCSNKTKHVSRSYLVWVWPGTTASTAVIIFDRVHSTDAAFNKTFLLHTLNKPELESTSAANVDIAAGDGALSGTIILPTNVSIRTIGGPGHEFEAGGQNWPPVKESNGVSGQWRLEVSPKTSQQDDLFLSAWQPYDPSGPVPALASRISWPGGVVVGVQVRERVAVFVAGSSGLANITSLDLRGGDGIVWSGNNNGDKTVWLHACGLRAGTWVASSGKTLGQVTAPSFCLVANVTKSGVERGPLRVSHEA